MPEIGEAARVVHYIRKCLVGKTLEKVVAPEDANVFGKVGTSGPAFEKALTGKKIIGAGQQGKYFWMIMDSPPHPVMHFGMTGWLHLRHEQTFYYKRSTPPPETTEWPPKFWKFTMETVEENGSPKVEAAFIDARRFARIRLIDCVGERIREMTPLKENGPDPVVDKDVVTLEWLTKLMGRKHVPVKALLLDQANISGIGNWVGDEVMYQAKLHPEQYSDTFSDEQLKRLHEAIHYVCGLAVETLSDSSKFPDEWLFKHRWGKGKKDAKMTLPNGEKITFLTVGGRTSCIVPSVQKKTGKVAGEIKKEENDDEDRSNISKSRKRKVIKREVEDEFDAEVDGAKVPVKSSKGKKARTNKNSSITPSSVVHGTEGSIEDRSEDGGSDVKESHIPIEEKNDGRRRSGRLGSRKS